MNINLHEPKATSLIVKLDEVENEISSIINLGIPDKQTFMHFERGLSYDLRSGGWNNPSSYVYHGLDFMLTTVSTVNTR
jgi:hypothetical protein